MGNPNCDTAVILTIDEYEAIRLIDKLGYSQEECGNYMQVARTTVQMIYNTARKKLADALVDGLAIRIEVHRCIRFQRFLQGHQQGKLPWSPCVQPS